MEKEQTSEYNYKDQQQGGYRGRGGKYRGRGGYYKNQNKRNDYNQEQDINEVTDQFNKMNVNKYQNKKPYYENKEVYDPYTAQMMIYRAEMYILTKYPHLVDLNVKNEGISKVIDEKDQFFIIKSFSEEDVHKSIKYNVWSSTKNGNQTLNNSFKMTKEKGGHVYLFYSTNGSGRYVGLARMKSEVDEGKQFMYWTQDSKWPGLFDVEWIFIKDVPFKCFRSIAITMK
jgi:hypothetical protein